ncbi:uncharacterized protein LOC110917625 isoform X2 [Helianthus annuus]|nr:uncharacterized protein LOC110917625 isoform X2 [Helianthus annuus]XP_022017812.1 uncharacterized protein LOC110917625 isoform X2 [Helianthus annuus]XP_035841103.1 uncharacterized protein LOC110917625 isoform X2 [Helianthus annuus]
MTEIVQSLLIRKSSLLNRKSHFIPSIITFQSSNPLLSLSQILYESDLDPLSRSTLESKEKNINAFVADDDPFESPQGSDLEPSLLSYQTTWKPCLTFVSIYHTSLESKKPIGCYNASLQVGGIFNNYYVEGSQPVDLYKHHMELFLHYS